MVDIDNVVDVGDDEHFNYDVDGADDVDDSDDVDDVAKNDEDDHFDHNFT